MSKNIQKISKFIQKLLQILQESKYNLIIKWTNDGTGVEILNRKLLETAVLTQHFKLKKVTSFIRQLHLYGFYKSKQDRKTNIFQHPLFIKNSLEDYSLIKRKYKEKYSQPSKESFETESSEVKQEIKKIELPDFNSINSIENVFKARSEEKISSNEIVFQEWYMNKEADLSFLLDDCLN